jgi:hypothetical protein
MKVSIPANDLLLDWLMEQAPPRTRRIRAQRRIPPQDIRCHHDLVDRLEAAGAGLPDVHVRWVVGLPALVHPNNVIFAIAAGTAWFAMRLPAVGRAAVVRTEWGLRGLGQDWIDIDPWLTNMESHEATARLRGWVRASYAYAGEVGPTIRPRVARGKGA